MKKKELIEKAQAFLKSEYELREEIRHYLSLVLMDSDEEHPLCVDITLDIGDYYGLSTLDMPHVTKCWQHPTEGWIYFEIDEYDCPIDFDDMRTQELITILEEID